LIFTYNYKKEGSFTKIKFNLFYTARYLGNALGEYAQKSHENETGV